MAVAGIEKTLTSLHAIAAIALSAPEVALAPAEAATLAHAIAEVNRHYKLPGMRPEHVALGSLAGALFFVYGGKIRSIVARRNRPAPITTSHEHSTGGNGVDHSAQPNWFSDMGLQPAAN